MRTGAIASVLVAMFGDNSKGPRRGAPKGTLVADPRNKRGNFSSRTKAYRLQLPETRPNCRAEYAGRVTRGKSAFIYPNTQR